MLDRVVALLGALSESGELLPGELAERCDLPASTTYRLIADLEQHGLVTRAGRRGTTLGLWILELARSVEDRLESELVEPAREVMEAARARPRRDRDPHRARAGRTRCASRRSRATTTRCASPTTAGARRRCTSAPRARSCSPTSTTPTPSGSSPTRRRTRPAARRSPTATLRRQIEETRRDGYLVTDGELDGGATAVAAPVLDARGRPLAGLSLAGPTPRVRAMLHEIVPAVVAGAAEIARRIDAP